MDLPTWKLFHVEPVTKMGAIKEQGVCCRDIQPQQSNTDVSKQQARIPQNKKTTEDYSSWVSGSPNCLVCLRVSKDSRQGSSCWDWMLQVRHRTF